MSGAINSYRIEKVGLGRRHARRRGRVFPVNQIQVASGSVWVFGSYAPDTKRPDRLRGVLYQVNPVTLAVVRYWRLRRTGGLVSVASGPDHTIWVGYGRTLRRLSTRTGATVARTRVRRGEIVGTVAADPGRRRLYAALNTGQTDLGYAGEYSARTGRLLVSSNRPPFRDYGWAGLTGVPGGVWALYRDGMDGQTVLLRRRNLHNVPLGNEPDLFDGWPFAASAVYGGGSLWTGTAGGLAACVAPSTGKIRAQTPHQLRRLETIGQILAVRASARELIAAGTHIVFAITAPARCWR